MADYSYDVDDPDGYDDYDDVSKVTPNTQWKNYVTKIKTVVVENGVRNIGSLAFMNCANFPIFFCKSQIICFHRLIIKSIFTPSIVE